MSRTNRVHATASIGPAPRQLLSAHTEAASRGPEEPTKLLGAGRCLPVQPADHEVQAALEALTVDGEVLA